MEQSQRELQPVQTAASQPQLVPGVPLQLSGYSNTPSTSSAQPQSTDQLLNDITAFDNWEQQDQSTAFRKLRKKVMYVSAASAVCIVISGMMNYLFQLDGELEVIKIVQEAENKPVTENANMFAHIFFAGLPGLFIALLMGMCVPACGYYGAKKLNSPLLCCFCCQNACGAVFGAVGAAIMLWVMTAFIPGADHWVQVCDPVSVCCQMWTPEHGGKWKVDGICDKDGLPLGEHKAAYLDCILGGHPEYKVQFPKGPHLSHEEPWTCVKAIPALTHCGDRFGMPPKQLEKELSIFKKKYPTTHNFYFADKAAIPWEKRGLYELFDLERRRDLQAFDDLHIEENRAALPPPPALSANDGKNILHDIFERMRHAKVHKGDTDHEVTLSIPGEKGTITLPKPDGVEGKNHVDVEKLVQGIFGDAPEHKDMDKWQRVDHIKKRLPHGWEKKLHHYGSKIPREVDLAQTKDDVVSSANNLASHDGSVQRHEAERLFHKGEKAWEHLNEDEEQRRPHHHHGGKHGGGDPVPKFDQCEVNEHAVKIFHKVHDKLGELVPKAEMLVGMKLLITLPLIVLWLVSSCWGCRLWKSARAGYRPTFFNANLQQGLMSGSGAQQHVVAPGVLVRPQDNVHYAVNYPGLQQQHVTGTAAVQVEEQAQEPSAFTPSGAAN